MAGELKFVPIDFERDWLPDALSRVGFEAGERTAWVWEGVVMYLSDAALAATLRGVADLSAAGSRLIIQYHTPARRGVVSSLILRWWSEPQIGERSSTAMAGVLQAAGFAILHDSGIDAWAERAAIPSPRMAAARQARVLVAERGPEPPI